MLDTPPSKCEICGSPGLGVFTSPFGAISHAYCEECTQENREVWATLIGGLFGTSRTDVADWALPIIKATCVFYGKTENQLWEEIARLEHDFTELMKSEGPTEDLTEQAVKKLE